MLTSASTTVIETLYAAGHRLLGSERVGEAAMAFRALVVSAERDERGWLGLSACHRIRGELQLALGLLTVGGAAAGQTMRIMAAQDELRRELERS